MECLEDPVKCQMARKNWQVCLPSELHHLLYEELHQKMGHLGAERAIALAKDRFCWPGLAKDISHFVTSVCPCLKDKKPSF